MKKPNVLLITTDQQHYSMLGAVNSLINTPNLDKLVSEGTMFNRAYCANPTCSPSRASILTGMYPSRHGCYSLGTKLSESVPTLSGYLRDKGYETALIGKAHFQPTKSNEEFLSIETPEYMYNTDYWRNFKGDFYGFDNIELLRNHTAEHWVGQNYVAWLEDSGCKDWKKYFFRPRGKMFYKDMGTWNIPEKYHYNAFIAQKTNELLAKSKEDDKPFFIWASFPDPHGPHLVPKPWSKMYDPNDMELPEFSYNEHDKNPPYFKEVLKKHPHLDEYRESGYAIHGFERHEYDEKRLKKQLALAYGMVSFTDKYIGIILDKLKELDLEKDTLIIFTTDHGDLFGQHGFTHKCIFHYEDLLRVPFIVKYKNHIPSNISSNSIQSLVDIAPTVLDYCGVDIPSDMQGMSEKANWNGLINDMRTFAICENRHEPHTLHMVSFIEKDYKLTSHEGRRYGELYDIKNDGEEHNNLWRDEHYKNIKADLMYKLLRQELLMDDISNKTFEKDGMSIMLDTQKDECKFLLYGVDVQKHSDYIDEKIDILSFALTKVIGERKIPMPRIANA